MPASTRAWHKCKVLTVPVFSRIAAGALFAASGLVAPPVETARALVAAVAVGSAARLPPGTERLGELPHHDVLRLDVALAPRNAAELAWLSTAVSTPGSSLRGHYLSPRSLDSLISPTAGNVRRVIEALQRCGFHVTGVSEDRLLVHVSASAGYSTGSWE